MDTKKSTLETGDAQAAAVAKTPNRVTLEHMESLIVGEEYMNSELTPHLTLCLLKVRNGYTLVGKSAPADPKNFNFELGKKFAREDALKQLWPLEGYLLAEWLYLEKSK